MSRRRHNIPFQLEPLEDRQVPTVTMSLIDGGDTLQILSDAGSDQLTIIQNDMINELQISWMGAVNSPVPFIPAVQTYQSSSIRNITIKMGTGNDSVLYQLTGSTMQWQKAINMDLGAGNDQTFIDFGGPFYALDSELLEGDPTGWPAPATATLLAALSMEINGNAGNDQIDTIFGSVSSRITYRSLGGTGQDSLNTQFAGTIMNGSRMNVTQDGGAGDDHLWMDLGYLGMEADSRVMLSQWGGSGHDSLIARAILPIFGGLDVSQNGGEGDDYLESMLLAGWPSTGNVRVRVNGNAGNDQMVVQLKREALPPNVDLIAPIPAMQISAVVNGGSGRNTASITPNVITILSRVIKRSWEIDWPIAIDPGIGGPAS